jgi:competence protein ComEC
MIAPLHRFLLCLFLAAASMWAQANGKLQLHFIDVGQGDGAILISPGGQTVAFDIGRDMVGGSCDKPVAYYDQLGIRKLDYLIVSHYHEDRIGCVPSVLASVSVDHVEQALRGISLQHVRLGQIDRPRPDNLETGDVPPAGKTLHQGCPTHR